MSQPKSLGEGAIGPAAQDLLGDAVSRVVQRGSGKRRKHKRNKAGAVYKRKKTSKRKNATKSKKRHNKRRKISFAPINFEKRGSASNQSDYFLPEPIVTQIERSFYREYTPISALQHQRPIEFLVPATVQITSTYRARSST